MDMETTDYLAELHAQKKRSALMGIAVAAFCLVMVLIIFSGRAPDPREISWEKALSRAPALALSRDEMDLANDVLEHDIFRNALNYELVDNTRVFTLEDTEHIISSVLPEGCTLNEIAVVGAVVVIDYTLPQHRIILEYVDADRSGTVDNIRKSVAPLIDGASTGCYQMNHNLITGKIKCTYTKY